ncbi:MAG: penicillin-binding transpeptidase domain-containing protein [Eubacterium sp.]
MGGIYKSGRTTAAIVLIAAVLIGFAYELFDIQITNNEYYAAQNNTVKTYTVPIEAARGDIVDRNGNPLVTSRQGNSIILDAAYFPSSKQNDDRNEVVLNLINLFNKNKEEYVHNLPLKLKKNGQVVFFTEADDDNYEADITTMKSADMLNLQPYATAQNCFDAMVEKYGLESYLDKYGVETVLEIGNIRYELTRLLFSVSNPVTIADDVSDETVAAIKESGEKYLGANVRVVAYREYADSSLAPHIIGTVRKINAEEYAELKEDGYSITDEIGESGIESACEEYLRGTPGEKTVTIDGDGNVTEEITKEPVRGDTIVLTIDKDLQLLSQVKLEEICKSVDYYRSTGAVVVEDCNNGEILAAASYPSYDLNDYYTKYNQLASNSKTPLYNRFAMGTYAPGSTFKPVMSAAALEEGVINENTTFVCSSAYRVNDMTFKCTGSHGSETVRTALRDSCNIFFYNCSKLLGIDKMNMYGSMFGLGEKTGVEIPEAKGILAGPEYRKRFDMTWAPGDTVQAAIGQSDNLFTPLQLSNYCATIANGGTRYQLHFVKSRISNATGIVTETGSNVVQTVDVSDSNLKIVREGMRLVATSGGPHYVFSQIDTNVACKTGTSQVVVNGVKHNNGFLITFAPYENPEISVASAIELAGSGTSTAEITSSIIDYYYSHNTNEKKAQKDATLLN